MYVRTKRIGKREGEWSPKGGRLSGGTVVEHVLGAEVWGMAVCEAIAMESWVPLSGEDTGGHMGKGNVTQ